MNRKTTNIIRTIMDEWIPPVIRDSKVFMFPFFWYAYRGKNIKTAMNFKRLVHKWSKKEYGNYYMGLNTISRNRKTDLSEGCIKHILKNIDKSSQTLLDVGCGKGYFLKRAESLGLKLTGCDIVDKAEFFGKETKLVKGLIEALPFKDNHFDVVVCSHTLEHIIDETTSIKELIRVAKKQVIITVPCQRYYYYTLDEHINFYPYKEKLTSLFNIEDYRCELIEGDWVYIGKLN